MREFNYEIRRTSELPCPAYKERNFHLECELVDPQGLRTTLGYPVEYKIALFNKENPPKLLLNNTSGDSIMRGTLQMGGDGTVCFRKLVIKEVSSHFVGSQFILVVYAPQCTKIRPYVFEELTVKARKLTAEELSKKRKTQAVET